MVHYSFKGWLFSIRNVCLCVRGSSSRSLQPTQTDMLSCWSALWSRGQGWLWCGTSLDEKGLEERQRKAGGVGRWWRCVFVARDNDSVVGHREEAHPRATAPPTSNMPYYVDLWRWLDSTFNCVRPGPSKDLSPHKIKGGQGVCQTKANSGGQRRSWTDLHWENPQIVVRPRRRRFSLFDVCIHSTVSEFS